MFDPLTGNRFGWYGKGVCSFPIDKGLLGTTIMDSVNCNSVSSDLKKHGHRRWTNTKIVTSPQSYFTCAVYYCSR